MVCEKCGNKISEENGVCAVCESQSQESEITLQIDSEKNPESKKDSDSNRKIIHNMKKLSVEKIKNIDKDEVDLFIKNIKSKVKNIDIKLIISNVKEYFDYLKNFRNLNDDEKSDFKIKSKRIAKIFCVLLAMIIVFNIFGASNGKGKTESEIMDVLYDTPVVAQVSDISVAYAIEAAFIDYEMTYSERSDGTYIVQFSGKYVPNMDVSEAISEGTVYITLDVESGKVFSITPENMKSTLMQYAIYM